MPALANQRISPQKGEPTGTSTKGADGQGGVGPKGLSDQRYMKAAIASRVTGSFGLKRLPAAPVVMPWFLSQVISPQNGEMSGTSTNGANAHTGVAPKGEPDAR